MKYHTLELKTKAEGGVFDIEYHDSISFYIRDGKPYGVWEVVLIQNEDDELYSMYTMSRNGVPYLNIDLTKEDVESWFATGDWDILNKHDPEPTEVSFDEFYVNFNGPDVQPIPWDEEAWQ